MAAKYSLLIFGLALCLAHSVFPQDRQADAARLFSEAGNLRKQNTPESKKEALEKYLAALKLWEESDDLKRQAEVLSTLTEISYIDSNIRDGLKYAKQALPIYQKLGERALEAEMLGNIGSLYDLTGETRTGIGYSRKAAEILRELGDKRREAIALNGLGTLYSNVGEMLLAQETLTRALDLRREVRDRLGEARTLANLGTINDETGEKRKAAELYEQSLRIAVEEKDLRTEGVVLNNLAMTWQHLGEYQRSLDTYLRSLELRRSTGNKFGEATTLNNIGTVYETLGETDQALAYLEQALEIYRTAGFRRNEARSLNSIGTMYWQTGGSERALEYYRKSLEIHRSLENKAGQASALRNIGLVYASQNRNDRALEMLRQALALAEEIGEKELEARVLTGLAQNLAISNDPANAAALYSRALELQREMGLRADVAETLYQFARLDESVDRRSAALEKMQEVLLLSEDLRSGLADQNFRTSFFAKSQKYFEYYVSLLVAMHRADPRKGFDRLALETSERLRARSLLESLGESRIDIRSGLDPELLSKDKVLRQTINAKETQRLNAARQSNSVKAGEFENEVGELMKQYRALQAEIRRRSPQFASLTQSEAIGVDEIQKNILDENTVLLEYLLADGKSYLFFAAGTSLEIFELPERAEIEKLARSLVSNLRARASEIANESPAERERRISLADASWLKDNRSLTGILLAPVAEKIRNKRLLIVSSGALQYVSFASLFNPALKDRFLVETNEIVNLPSVSALAALRLARETKPRTNGKQIAVLADPVFGFNDARFVRPATKTSETVSGSQTPQARLLPPGLGTEFSRLRFSRREADQISGLLPVDQKTVAVDFEANLKSVSSEAFQTSRIIHLATHGIVNASFPELSGVVLSLIDENGKPREGFLRLHDIYNLRINADLVVLSACETALGKEIQGEGLIGLTRGFMYAGNSDVVASLWKVDDKATSTLMRNFYQNMLRNNLPASAALRKAQMSMLSQQSTRNPFYWAAFTLQGDWKARVR